MGCKISENILWRLKRGSTQYGNGAEVLTVGASAKVKQNTLLQGFQQVPTSPIGFAFYCIMSAQSLQPS